jgi:hypothetical protein
MTPEPWASLTDYITASQLLESAIHATSQADAAGYLARAAVQLDHAAGYWSQLGDQGKVMATHKVAGQFHSWEVALKANALPNFMPVLYNQGQGMMADLVRPTLQTMLGIPLWVWVLTIGGVGLGLYVLIRKG